MLSFLFIAVILSFLLIIMSIFVPKFQSVPLLIGVGTIIYIPTYFLWFAALYFQYVSIDALANRFSINSSDTGWRQLLLFLPPAIPTAIILLLLSYFIRHRTSTKSAVVKNSQH